MKNLKSLTNYAISSLILATAVSGTNVKAATGKIDLIGGANRYETSAKVAKANWTKGAENVIIASGEDYADALSASVLAKKLDAPILLTRKGQLETSVKNAVKKLNPKNVFILGGEGAISKNVEKEVGNAKITRLQGKDRFATNIAIANYLVEKEGVNASDVLVVNGKQAFSDGLSVAPVAAAQEKLLLIVSNDLGDAKEAIKFVKDHNSKVTVVGSETMVPSSVYNGLNAQKRVKGGHDRFETNLNILKTFNLEKGKKMYFANAQGDKFPDALVASALAGKFNSPLVLVNGQGSNADNNAINYIKEHADKNTDLQGLGSNSVMPNSLIEKINKTLENKAKDNISNEKENNASSENSSDTNNNQQSNNSSNPKTSLFIKSVTASNGKLIVKMNKEMLKVPNNLKILKTINNESNYIYSFHPVINSTDKNKLEITIPKIESSTQGAIKVKYSVTLQDDIFKDDNLKEVSILIPAKLSQADQIINIPDPKLKEVINHFIDENRNYNDNITKKDMEHLYYIDSRTLPILHDHKYTKGIKNLEGLQYAKNLTTLYLESNLIEDISPLKRLTSLKKLNLQHNNISNIDCLKNLKSLSSLDLGDNSISNIDPLKYLTNINFLGLEKNNITKLTPLSNLKKLTYIDINNNKNITDIEPICNLTQLNTLNMSSCNSKNEINFQPICNLINLRKLILDNNFISDISFSKNLLKLEYFTFNHNYVYDLTPIQDFILATQTNKNLYINMGDQNYENVIKINASNKGGKKEIPIPIKGLDKYINKLQNNSKANPFFLSVNEFNDSNEGSFQKYALASYNEKNNTIELSIKPNNSNKKINFKENVSLDCGEYNLLLKIHITQEGIQ
ncbi:cell wall-binding repeat-containing protein [Clostridium oceanicum]|uniref:Cell wall-binding repeat-containing protein n=1 Tax=Clostridium oceanicum TaxID=1543 RepID=A0ABN1J865_9CLOT